MDLMELAGGYDDGEVLKPTCSNRIGVRSPNPLHFHICK